MANRIKVYKFEGNGMDRCVEFKCPGCGSLHQLTVVPHTNGAGASWSFNGSLTSPTLTPSILSKCGPFPKDCNPAYIIGDRKPNADGFLICHSFVTNGQIKFLSDCTHAFAGQTLDLPEYNGE